MTKFDHAVNLPAIFEKHKLSIQPTSRGTYAIGRFESYFKTPHKIPTVEEIEMPPLQSLDAEHLDSEAAAILCAFHAGMISGLLNSNLNLDFTVFGRMGTSEFEYSIGQLGQQAPRVLQVKNAQCEIDGGFENDDVFCIVEAKNATVSDFLIRQLYYPYRLWTHKIGKPVVPISLTFSNDVFLLRAFAFRNEKHYNSLEIVAQKSYSIASRRIELTEIIEIARRAKLIKEPPITFPQANSFARVLDLLAQMRDSPLQTGAPLQRDDITQNQDFDVRQTNYYTDAAIYLGLAEKHSDAQGISFTLTTLGRNIMKRRARERNLALIERILQHEVFSRCFALYLRNRKPPTSGEIEAIMKRAHLVGLDPDKSTFARRASTVSGWLRWILELARL